LGAHQKILLPRGSALQPKLVALFLQIQVTGLKPTIKTIPTRRFPNTGSAGSVVALLNLQEHCRVPLVKLLAAKTDASMGVTREKIPMKSLATTSDIGFGSV